MITERMIRAAFSTALLVVATTGQAQLTVTPQTNLQELARSITGPGVQISNVSIDCHSAGYGEFSYTGNVLSVSSGVLLTSGSIANAVGPNNVEDKTFEQNRPGSALLNQVTGRTTYDACKLQLDVIPGGDTLRFNFAFASEEYNEWVGSQYNDVFGFFISGPGIVGDPGIAPEKNIALVPGTNQAVTINNVNGGSNQAYFLNNAGGQHLQYDGLTTQLQAVAVVEPCQTYTLKLIVADASDRKFDSGVFIERLQSNSVTMEAVTVSGFPNLVEGCNDGMVRFTRQVVTPDPLSVPYFLQGTATNGVDYPAVGDPDPMVAKVAVIPGGQASVEVPFQPFADGLNEGSEYIRVLLSSSVCPGFYIDSLDLVIQDSLYATVNTPAPICHGGNAQLQADGGMTYTWSPATGLSTTTGPAPLASPGTTTTYTVTVEAGSCQETLQTTVTVSALSLSGSVTSPLCNGNDNGAIALTVSGGVAPYTYAWTGPNGFTANTEDLTGLSAGSYTVVVTDGAGCSISQGFNVTAPNALQASSMPSLLPFGQNISCAGGNDGAIDLSVGGGTAPYAYVWSGPNGFSATTQDIANLIAGTYSVTITDANGCSITHERTLVEPPSLSATFADVVHVLCSGANTGSATAVPQGGMPPYTYSWNTVPVQNAATATALSAGDHTVTVTDMYGCTAQGTVTIEGGSAALAVTFTNVETVNQCQNDATPSGSATAVVSGGVGPYTYSWNTVPVQTDATVLLSAGGTYTVTVTDANGCTGSNSVSLGQTSQPSIAITTLTHAGCSGLGGSATVAITGGAPVSQIIWNTTPAQTGATATGLAPGTWTATAQHTDGCVTSIDVTVDGPTESLSATITSLTDALCFGDGAGSASVTASGGTAPYTYGWNTVPPQTDATATGLPAGTWTVTVTDANGCTASASATINGPTAPLTVATTIDGLVLCYGGDEGSITASASGGTAPYTYTWSTGQNGPTISDLPIGSYTVTVSDANGCTTSATVDLVGPEDDLFAFVESYQHVSCHGLNDGSATLSITGGSGSYTVYWNTEPPQTGPTATGLAPGNYLATVYDNNGCTVPKFVPFTINGPDAPLGVTAVISDFNGYNVLCHDSHEGFIDITITGGTAPYTHVWTDDHGNSTGIEDLSDLDPDNYHLSVIDAGGCTLDTTFTLIAPPAITASATITTATCQGSATGAITGVTVGGGVGPYTLSWSGPDGFSSSSTDITDLAAGIYLLTVTDAHGCVQTHAFDVSEPGVFTISSTLSEYVGGWNVSCNGATDGSIDVEVTGGTGQLSYQWTGPNGFVSTTQDITDLGAGTYQLTVTDENGCSTLTSFTLTQPAPLTLTHQASNYSGYGISCAGAEDGFIGTTISGGTPDYNSISWTGPDGFTANTQSIYNLAPGTYTMTVSDENGCSATLTVTITAPLPLNVVADTSTSPSGDAVACNGASTGSISLAITGGATPVTVSWTGPDGYTGNGANISGLAAGTYNATITDANGCSETVQVTLTEPAPIEVDATLSAYNGSAVSCAEANDGSITTNVTGGYGAYTFSWTGPNGFTSTDASLSGLVAGTYTVTISDGNGCSLTRSYTLDAPAPIGTLIVAGTHGDHHVSCNEATDGSIVLTISGGTTPYTIAWNGPDGPVAGTTELNDLAAGTYTVTVTDANGCTLEASITLTAPQPLNAATTTSTYGGGAQVSCSDAQDGSIDLTVTGGTAPYTYAWSDGLGFNSTDEDLSGLAPGTYTVTVTDAMGCSTTTSVTLDAPEPLTMTAELSGTPGSNVSCTDAQDGSITLSISGGVAPYTYLWSNNSQAAAITGLPAGTYSVTVTDANGCTITGTWTLEAPEAIDVNTTVALQPNGHGVSCNGAADGAISTTISGGTAPYTTDWTGPNGFTAQTADITGLVAGTYTLTVVDAHGCTQVTVVHVTQPAPVTVQLSSSTVGGHHIACTGDSTGSVDLTVSGGTAGYTYLWSGPDGFTSTAPTISGLTAGTYTVIVTDDLGCTGSASITLTEPDPLQVDATLSDAGAGHQVSCAGNDGSITVVISGGIAPISFGWMGPNGFASTATSIDGLAPGTYTLHITDANGCTLTSSWTLTAPEIMAAEFAAVANTCPGDATGSIDLTVLGGVSPFSHAWSGPNGFTSTDAQITGLEAGAYTVTVTDAMGCTATFSHTLEGPAPLNSGAYVSFFGEYNIQCFGDSTGVIELAPEGGTAPYSVLVNGPAGYVSSSLSHTGLTAGDYHILITDANSCVLDTTITLTAPVLPIDVSVEVSVYPSGTNVSCYGAADGWILATATGGSGQFTFVWRGPDSLEWNTPFIDGLSAGQYAYELVVTDQNQCTYSMEVTLTQPDAPLQADITVSEYPGGHNVPCSDATNGTITVVATGGNGGNEFAWTGPNGFTSTAFELTDLAPGTYELTLTDMNGCVVEETVTLTAPEPLGIALTGSSISCNGLNDGSVSAVITGGTPAYTLTWTGPTPIASDETTLTDLAPGTYCLTVTDANGCETQSCTTITEPEPLAATLATEVAACGMNVGAVLTTVTGGTAPFSFAWDHGATSADVTGLAAGTYGVTVTDANGCTVHVSAEVTGTPAVTADADVTGNICHGDAQGTITLNMLTGTGPYTYAWSNGATEPSVEGLTAGTYEVTVTDTNGCTFTGSWHVWEADAIVIDTLLSVYSGGYNVSTHGGSNGSIQTNVSGGTAPYAYAWSNGATTSNISGLTAGTYVLVVTDANGCAAEITIEVTQPDDLVMPTGFTPNGDGANDTFFIRGLDAYPANTFTVFNRWGNVVYDRLNYANDWRGENQQQDMLPNGTYFVILKVNGGERTLQGYVDLRR